MFFIQAALSRAGDCSAWFILHAEDNPKSICLYGLCTVQRFTTLNIQVQSGVVRGRSFRLRKPLSICTLDVLCIDKSHVFRDRSQHEHNPMSLISSRRTTAIFHTDETKRHAEKLVYLFLLRHIRNRKQASGRAGSKQHCKLHKYPAVVHPCSVENCMTSHKKTRHKQIRETVNKEEICWCVPLSTNEGKNKG